MSIITPSVSVPVPVPVPSKTLKSTVFPTERGTNSTATVSISTLMSMVVTLLHTVPSIAHTNPRVVAPVSRYSTVHEVISSCLILILELNSTLISSNILNSCNSSIDPVSVVISM